MINNIIYYHTSPFTIEKTYTYLDELPSGYLLIKFLYCGICGGDYSYFLGRRRDYPVSLGHEWIGEVIQVNDDINSIKIGDHVVTDFNYRCEECDYCTSGRSHLCCNNNVGLFSNRGFACYANIHHSYLYPISNLEWLPRACLVEPLSCVLHAMQLFKISLDTPVLLCGGGSIGMLMCFYLTRVMNHRQVYLTEKNDARLANLIKYFKVQKFDSYTSNLFNDVIDCTNSIDGIAFAINSVKKGGNICIMSHLYGLDTSFIYETICKKELYTIFPLRNGNTNNINIAIEFIQKFWTLDDDCMIQIYNDVIEAFEDKEFSSCNKQIISLSNVI